MSGYHECVLGSGAVTMRMMTVEFAKRAPKRASVKPVGLLLAPCLLLAACSGEPGESDMRKLVESHTRKALESKGNGPFLAFDEFRKQGCVDSKAKQAGMAQGMAQYDCYYAATFAPQPGRPPITVNGKGRFTRTDKGLEFEDLGAQPR